MRKTFLLIIAFSVCLAGYAVLESSVRANYRERARITDDAFILPESRYVPVLAMGFNHLWAQYTMLQSQVFFSDHKDRATYASGKTLKKLLELAITLDPKLTTVGLFSSFVLGEYWGPMGLSDANELLIRHFGNNPDDYNLPKYIAFNYFFNNGDPQQVVKWVKVALDNPEAPRALIWMADAALRDQNENFAARARIMCEICQSSVDKNQRENACKRCKYLNVADKLDAIRQRYQAEKGPLRYPSDLVRAGYIADLPKDPLGGYWTLDDAGRIDSSVSIKRKNEMNVKR